MTAILSESTVTVQNPRRTRSQVLFDTFENVADQAKENAGKWMLVGGGPTERLSVFSQTAYRIRRGLIKAFADPQGGYWEVQVSTDQRVADRQHPVEVYLRFVPVEAA